MSDQAPYLYVTVAKRENGVREVTAFRVEMQGPYDGAVAEAHLLAAGVLPEGVSIVVASPDIVHECESVADLCVKVLETARR